jgi:arylsulfatase A-like enzyme
MRPAALALVLAVALNACARGAAPAVPARPNLILVVLDDADAALVESSAGFARIAPQRLRRFTRAFANTPLCGPARSVILSGQFAHNTQVRTNAGTNGGYEAWRAWGYDRRNLGVWLKAAGYRTALLGKYQNDFPAGAAETFVPPGWDAWHGVLSDRETTNDTFTINDQGRIAAFRPADGAHQTDLLRDRAVEFVRKSEEDDDAPFFIYLAPSAPHTPSTPARRHADAFPGLLAPRPPSFDEPDLSDKPEWLRTQAARLAPDQIATIDANYRGARQALLAVEEALAALFGALDAAGETSRTWVFLTSDNGLHRGEHRIPWDKKSPYEESIRVPLLVWGPGPPAAIDALVGHVDLAPTLARLGGAAPDVEMDGMDLGALLGTGDSVRWRDALLIEGFGGGAPFTIPRYVALRLKDAVFVENNRGEREYYDLARDPYQLENVAGSSPPDLIARLSARAAAARSCAGDSCRAIAP